MKQVTKQKQKIKNQGFILEEFEVVKPTYQTNDQVYGVSSQSQIKTIRYQSQGLTHPGNQQNLTAYQRQEVERQRKNQQYLFHIGNHARTVSDIMRFRNEQYQQSQSNQNISQQESNQQKQKAKQIQESNSTVLIQQYQQYQQIQMLNSTKRSATVSNLKSQGQSARTQNMKDVQSFSQSQNKQTEISKQPVQYYTKQGIQSLLGSQESQISPIKQKDNDQLATAGDTRDNIFTVSQSSQKANPLNFTFQDHQNQKNKDYQSIQRTLFDSRETNQSNANNNDYIPPISQLQKDILEIDQIKKSKLDQNLNQGINRLLQFHQPESISNQQQQSQQSYSSSQPQFYPSFKQQVNPINYNSDIRDYSENNFTKQNGTNSFSLNLTKDNFRNKTTDSSYLRENKTDNQISLNDKNELKKSNLTPVNFQANSIKPEDFSQSQGSSQPQFYPSFKQQINPINYNSEIKDQAQNDFTQLNGTNNFSLNLVNDKFRNKTTDSAFLREYKRDNQISLNDKNELKKSNLTPVINQANSIQPEDFSLSNKIYRNKTSDYLEQQKINNNSNEFFKNSEVVFSEKVIKPEGHYQEQYQSLQVQDKSDFLKPAFDNLSKYYSSSTLETNQLGSENKNTEPKFINNFTNNQNGQIKSYADLTAAQQPNYFSQVSTPLLASYRQFKIRLTKVTQDSQILEEYQLNKIPPQYQQKEIPQSSGQNLMIEFIEQKKQDYLNNLQEDNSDFSKTPQTNKSEVIKRFKASQIYSQDNSSQQNQNRLSNYSGNTTKNDFSKRVEAIQTFNEANQSNLISSAQKTHFSHQTPSSILPGMGRINNFVRKSQELNQQNYQNQYNEPSLYFSKNMDQVKTSTTSYVPIYHLPENYQSLQTKNSNTFNQFSSQPSNYQLYNQQNYSSINQGNQTNKLESQPSGHTRQYSFQPETQSSLSLIKNILEAPLETKVVQSNSLTFQEQTMKSPKSSQLESILNKYKLIKESDNLRESTKFFSQTPQSDTRNSFTKLINQPMKQSGTALFNIQIEQQKQIGQNDSQQVRSSLSLLENEKIKQIMNDLQTKKSLRNSQSLEQTPLVISEQRQSQYKEKMTSQVQELQQQSIQNGLTVSFANNSNIPQSTFESSTNLQQKIQNLTQNPNSYSNLFTEQGELNSFHNKLDNLSTNVKQSIYSNMIQSQQAGSRKEIENVPSQNNFNLTFEDLNKINQEMEKSQQQSERKITQVDLSSDKSVKEEQDKTYDSENRYEMCNLKKNQFEKKIETMSNTHDMSQLLCQTPIQQNGQHFRLMSGGNMENLTLNNSMQSLPQDQITQSTTTTTMINNQPNQSNNNSCITTQNHLQYQPITQSNFCNTKGKENPSSLKNSQEIKQSDLYINKIPSSLRNSTEINNSQNKIKNNMKNSSEMKKSQEWNMSTPKKDQNDSLKNQIHDKEFHNMNTPQTIVSVQFNEQQDEQVQGEEDYAIQYDNAEKRDQERKEYDLNNGLNEEPTVNSVFQSPLACLTCKNEDQDNQGYFPSAKQFYNNQKDFEEEGENNQQQLKQSEDEFNIQTQDTLMTSQKNPNHVRFNNSNNQLYNILSTHRNNLGFYHYQAINIEGKIYKDDFQQTEPLQLKSVCVQTQDQSQSKRNSIFDECTKLFSPKMKFIEPDFRENQCQMLNISNQSSQIDQKDKEEQENNLNEDKDFKLKQLRKSDLFNQKQNLQPSSSNGNYETGFINSSLYNSQKGESDNEEVLIKQQQQIYNKIFEEDELPIVENQDLNLLFKEFQPFGNKPITDTKNRTYSSQYSEKEKKKIQNQIDSIVNKKGQKCGSKQQQNVQSNNNNKAKEALANQNKNKSQQNSISPIKKHISFNNKIENRKIVAGNKDQQNSKKEGIKTERVFERLYPQKLNKQKDQIIYEIKQEKSKSKSKSKSRSISNNKGINGEMDFIQINKQNVPYMMKKKVDDKFTLFKKAVEFNLENMIQDQKSHQIKSIILDDEDLDKSNLKEIFQKSLINRTQKNLVSYDTITMINRSRYNPSYNP